MKELKKILYAEDEIDIQVIVDAIVKSMSSYEIMFCNNGQEVLDIVEEYNPDLILLDIMMPEVDGLTAFQELQKSEKTKNIPVVFITAKAQVHEVQSFLKTGVIGIITKPFDPMQLCSNINAIWEKHVDG
ncbi:MAG: response regulator [Candidatus Gastranaerophilales bacterium]|nr:response regulator [Candidatus Gastranaerophilales bacterium]